MLLVAVALLFWASGKRAPPAAAAGTVVLADALATTGNGRSLPVEPVQLPYQWDSHHPGERGSATFDVSFELTEEPREPWALLFPKIGNAYEVTLNGARLASRGSLKDYDSADSSLLPRQIPLGGFLREGSNHLEIVIRADRGRDAGLSKITIGPASVIREETERRYNRAIVGATTIVAISLGVGLLALGFWRSHARTIDRQERRGEALYIYAAAAEFTHALVAATSLLETPPLPWPWWGATWNTTLGASIGLTTLFCRETAEWGRTRHATRLRRWLAVLVLACTPASYASLGLGSAWAMSAWYLALGITVAAFAAHFVLRAFRGATLAHQLAAVAILANVAAGAHDFYSTQNAGDYLHPTMLVYSSILFDLVLGIILILRFRAANRRTREAMQDLTNKFAQRERELGESYGRLEQLARGQERMNERASILRDMHDGVGAHLAIALRQLESGNVSKEGLLAPMRDALDQLKLTIDNVNLPPGDVASLMANLRYRLGHRIESSGIRLQWEMASLTPVDRLDVQSMRHLMFILFEAISNVLQHSSASDLRIEAAEVGEGIRMRVIDNGVGFDVAASSDKGLLTLRNRAERIGARLDIRSLPGETAVELFIPR